MNINQNHISLLKQYTSIGQDISITELLKRLKQFATGEDADAILNVTNLLGGMTGAMGDLFDSANNAGRGLGEFYSISQDLSAIITDIQKESAYLEQRYNRLNRVFGVSSITAGKFGERIDRLGQKLNIGGGYALEYATQLSKLAPNMLAAFNAENKFAVGLLNTQDALIANLGLSEDQAVNFQRFAATRADTTDEFLNQTLAIAQAIEESTDIEGAFRDITLEISRLSTSTRQQFGRIPGSLEVSVLKAKQLGTSFEEISKTGRQLLNVEETINAELEYQLLSGQRLVKNGKSLTAEFQKAFLSGDAERMAQAQYDIVDSQRDVIKTNVLAREQLAKFMGISSDELLNQAEQLDTIDKLSASGIDIDLSSADVDQQIADAIAKAQSDDQKKLLEEFKTQRQGVQSTEDYLKQLVDLGTTKGLLTNIANLGTDLGIKEDEEGFKNVASLLIAQQQTAFGNLLGQDGSFSNLVNAAFGNMDAAITRAAGSYINFVDGLNELGTILNGFKESIPFINGISEILDSVISLIPGIGQGGTTVQTFLKGIKDMVPDEAKLGNFDRAAQAQGITISANTLEVGEIQTRHSGGPVAKGEPYIVGEGGPELMIPDQSGTIVPNNQIASSNNAGPAGMTPDQLAAVAAALVTPLVTAMSSVTLMVEQSPEGINIS